MGLVKHGVSGTVGILLSKEERSSCEIRNEDCIPWRNADSRHQSASSISIPTTILNIHSIQVDPSDLPPAFVSLSVTHQGFIMTTPS
jgi:hypothetical protein